MRARRALRAEHLRILVAALALASAGSTASAAAFAPGEETVFQVRWFDVLMGEGRIVVGRPAGEVWPVVFQARTDGVGGLVDLRQHLVTYWDSTTNLTRGFDLRAYEMGEYHQDRTRFDRARGKATTELERRNGPRTVRTIDVPPGVHDLASAFMWLRMQPLEPGDRHEVPVCTGFRHFIARAEVLGRETVATPAGTFRTVKLQVRVVLKGRFETRRDSYLWLSDDPRHVMVRMSADLALGTLVATLKTYRPGERAASR